MPKTALALLRDVERWTERDARSVLAELEASGLSVAEFAERTGFDRQRLYWWRRRLGSGGSHAAFAEVITVPSADSQRVELVLRSGRVLRFSSTLDAADLRRFVDALELDEPC